MTSFPLFCQRSRHGRGDVLDLVNPRQFDESEWIGNGRTYPANQQDVPPELSTYCDHLLEIPTNFAKAAFPDAGISIEKFLKLRLLKPSFSVVHVQADRCFTRFAANEDPGCLLIWPIPSRAFIDNLKKSYGQAVLNGSKSVEDPRYPGSRLPLWCIQFWTEILLVIDAQMKWRQSLTWIDNCLKAACSDAWSTHQLARTHLLSLRWNEITNIPGAGSQTTTLVFARLLSDEWINDTLIDMMFSQLSERVEEYSILDSFVIIETLRFMQDINKASSESDHTKPLTSFLKHLENRIRKGKFETLIFPVHLGQENHWLAFKIDFEHGELSYGDSLSH